MCAGGGAADRTIGASSFSTPPPPAPRPYAIQAAPKYLPLRSPSGRESLLHHRLSLDRVLARKIRSRLLATLSRATSPSSICGVPMGILGSHEGIACGV